ncbi:MAG: hypothetical protein ACI9TV_000049 [Sulfurimonas sp.]|jgi:hypothetical protein|uniref:hypothetical protein n=1 Tax=Sulfurimonas sp. TaxID=2022749 RepID=UPI0039E487B4
MKYIQLIFLLLPLSTLTQADISMDEKIKALKSESSPQKRVTMMNQLKVQLSQMNQVQREETLSKLKSTQSSHVQTMQTPVQKQMHNEQMMQQKGLQKQNLKKYTSSPNSQKQQISKPHH